MDARREAKLRKQLGTTGPIGDGCWIQRPGSPTGPSGLVLFGDTITFAASIAVSVALAARRSHRERQRPVKPLPDRPLALMISGDEVLVGRKGRVLRRYPTSVLATVQRPRLSTEITLDDETFIAGGVEGDILLKLRRSAPKP